MNKNIRKNILKTVLIPSLCLLVCIIIEHYLAIDMVAPAIMALAVFLVSRVTEGYVYGIVASILSVLALNFVFAFPYFAFNFSIPENIISALIMLIITIMTSTVMTQLKWQEKVRAESAKEKMRGNLLRAVSHDFRTPLTTIYGSSTTIIENYDHLKKEQILQLTTGIREDAQWLMNMVENILSITRIDNGGVRLKKNSVVLEELINSVLVKFKKRYPNQKVTVSIPDEFISIPMDAVLIEQVIINILENAVQHAQGMTELSLTVHTEGRKVVFEIADNGCGIPKERLKSIFKDYFEIKDAPVDHNKKSMGIGLAVCASIIKAHDGEISVENREEGGCIFRFTLDEEDSLSEQL